MSDDTSNEIEKATGVGVVAGLAALSPTAAVLTAVGNHVLTNFTSDAKFRKASLGVLYDALADEASARSEQYKKVENEFERHQFIRDWIVDELKGMSDRVDALEAMALNIMAGAEGLARRQPDPAMRPYFVTAYRNAIQRSDTFTPHWVKKLTDLLAGVGEPHMRFLQRLVSASSAAHLSNLEWRGTRYVDADGPKGRHDDEETVAFLDLLDQGLVVRASLNSGPTLRLSHTVCKLVEFTTDWVPEG